MVDESKAVERYNILLHDVVIPAVSNETTTDVQLLQFARKAFPKKKFHGVYMANEIPGNISAARPYAIINLDPPPGSHWIAVAWLGPQSLLVYDSFGALHTVPEALLRLYPKSTTTDPDIEQGLRETNCGARALAWLMLFDMFGAQDAKQI